MKLERIAGGAWFDPSKISAIWTEYSATGEGIRTVHAIVDGTEVILNNFYGSAKKSLEDASNYIELVIAKRDIELHA